MMNKKLVFLASMFALAAMIPTTTHGGLRRGEHHENEHSISKRPESEGEAEEIKEAWEKAADDFSHIEEDRREEIKKLYQETQDLADEITQDVLASLAEDNIEEHFESMQYSLTLPNDNFPNLASSEEVDTKISNISPNISTVFDNFNLETIETRSFHLLNFEKNILHIKGDEGPTEGIFFLTKYALMGMSSSSFPSPEAEKLGNKFAEIYKSYYTPEEFWSQFSSQLFKNASPTVADLVIHLEYVKQLGAILESYNYQSREEKLDYVQKLVDFYNSPKGNLSDMFKKVSEIAKALPRSFQADILQQALGEILFQQRDVKDLPMECEDLRLINCKQKRKRTENEKVGVETRKKAKDSEDSSRQSNANFVRETKKKRNPQEMEEAFKTALGGYEISENDDPNEIAKKFSEVAGIPNSDKTRSYQVTAYVELKEDIVIGEKASRHVFATLVKPETSDRISRTAEKVNAHVLTRKLEKEGKKDFRHAEILIFELLVKEHCKKLKDKCEFACESTDWSKIGIDLSKYIVGGKIGVSKFICPQCNKHLSHVKISSNQEVSGRNSPHWFTPFKGVKCPGNLFSSIIRANIKTVKASTDPLFIAVNKGDYKTVQDLLLKGVDPDIRDVYNEMTPLLVAMDNFYDSVADLMLSLGASPTLADTFGQTPLIYASQNLLESSFYHLCNMDLPKEIVDQQDCQIGFSALHLATENHHVGMVTSLADLGADINIVSTEGSQTPLHLATMNSDIEIANVLLSYGADVNLENDDGVKCLAEANLGLSGDDVRIIPLNSPGLGLNVLSKQKWEILRPTEDKDFIKPALKFVKAIADEVEYDTRGVASTATKAHYAYIGAIACLFGSAAMGMEAKKRLFLTYAKLINGIGQKDYFCSNLVSECLQLGEFKVRMKRLLQDEKIPTQDLDTWAKQMAEKYGSELDLRLTFKFDPLYVSPQKLRNLLESEYKYKQVLKITGKGAAPLT